MAYQRVLVADQANRIVAELQPDLAPVSWRLNNVGKTELDLSKLDSKATLGNLQFGNRVLIQFDNGLPDWGGVIDPPRKWKPGMITATAYSAEYIFGQRITGKGRYFSGVTIGAIYQALIREANEERLTGIEIGEIYTGGPGHSPDYHFKDLLTIFKDSLTKRLSDYDFDVTAQEDSGYIRFYANLYETKGTEKLNLALVEGRNLVDIKMDEQGPLVNSWDMAGKGSGGGADGWGDERLTSHEEDETSIASYGLRQDSRVYNDVSIQDTLDAHAENALAESKDPRVIMTLDASNHRPALFSEYDVGDVLQVVTPSYGFGGMYSKVRVLGREYSANTGFCKLVIQVMETSTEGITGAAIA